jgi:two-component system alkaline phosphatase synthesis response regulator PhoP
MSGLEVLRTLRREGVDTPVIVLSAKGEEVDRVVGLKVGADDYVPKPFSPREVVARVQALLRRAGPAAAETTPPPLRVGALEIDLLRRSVRMAERPVSLTPTELRLLEALASRPGRTFTREELVARTFGPDYDGLDRTIDTHITNLRRKLEQGQTARYIVTVHGIGYQMPQTPQTDMDNPEATDRHRQTQTTQTTKAPQPTQTSQISGSHRRTPTDTDDR